MPRKDTDDRASKKRCAREGGMRCPFCEADAISAESPEADGAIVVVLVACERCRRRWHDCYDLATVSELGEDGGPVFDDQSG
jgi:hypothetical protein